MIRLFCLFLLAALPAHAETGFRWIAEPRFADAGSAHRGVVPLLEGGRWGLMDASGAWVAPPQFLAIGGAGDGRFAVQGTAGGWGAVDTGGQIVIPLDYDAIGTPGEITPALSAGVWVALDRDGIPQAEPLAFDTLIGNEGTCMAGTSGGQPVLDHRGAEPKISPLDADQISAPSDGHVVAVTGALRGHVECPYGTMSGGAAEFDAARRMSEGLAAVQSGGLWGYTGLYAGFEISPQFAAAREFSEGLAPVQYESGLWGYIDRRGELVIAAQFDQAYSFSDGLAGVQIGDKRGFITPDGQFAADPQFDDFWRHDGGVVPVRVGELWGVIAPAATDPATRLNLPLASLVPDTGEGFSLQPSNPHYYVLQDIASLHAVHIAADESVMTTVLAYYAEAEVALWDFRSRRLIRKFPLPEATQAALLPGRPLLAAGLTTGHLVVMDAVTGAELARIRPHQGAVIDMVLSPDGRLLATTDGQAVQIWDAGSGAAVVRADVQVEKLRFTSGSDALFGGNIRGGLVRIAPDGAVTVLAPDGPLPEGRSGPFGAAVADMALSDSGVLVNLRRMSEEQPDGSFASRSWAAVTTADGTRDVPLAEGVRDILTLDISADGSRIAYAGSLSDEWVAVVEVRDLATGEAIFTQVLDRNAPATDAGLARYIYSVDRLAFTPSGQLVLVGMEGQDILLLDPGLGKVTGAFGTPLVPAQSGTALLDGTRYFATDGSGNVWVWDLAEGRLETRVALDGEAGFGVEEMLEPEGTQFYLYSGLEEGMVAAFDMATLQPLPLSPDEAAAIAARMDFDGTLAYPDDLRARLEALPVAGADTALAGGRLAVADIAVGLHSAYDVETGALLAQFLATPDGEWLMLTPEGFFAASEHGARLVSVSTGLRAFSVDQVYQALYRPDLVREKLAGDPQGLVAQAAARLDLGAILQTGPAPRTRLSLPLDGTRALSEEIDVTAEVGDEGGGVGRVEWRLNGVTVDVQGRSAAPLGAGDDVTLASTRVALEPGPNVIEVVAYNAAGLLASAPQSLTVTWDGVASTVPPALHVLAIGVNDYADGRLQLNFAAADASAFGAALQKAGTGLFSAVEVTTLLDADVTAAGLDAAFATLAAKVKPQDVFVFFIAGHGKTVEGTYYFIPQDFRFDGDDPVRTHGIGQDQWQAWIARIKARKSVMIYDTCESGSVTDTRSVDAAMAQSAAVQRLTRATGRTILSASTDDAPALEGYNGHGVMTYALLEGMDAGDANGNATIEVTEMAGWLDARVPEISAAAFGLRQVPQMLVKGSDFALGAKVGVLAAVESFPAVLTHVAAGGTAVAEAPGGAPVMEIDAGVFFGVYLIEEADGWARVAKDGRALGWLPATALTPLQ